MRSENPDGSGTLIFSKQTKYDPSKFMTVPNEQLVGIPNVSQVEQIVRDTFKINTPTAKSVQEKQESYWNE
jgi:hypothetical protein